MKSSIIIRYDDGSEEIHISDKTIVNISIKHEKIESQENKITFTEDEIEDISAKLLDLFG